MCISLVNTRDTYAQCRASRSELVRLKVLVCAHDFCNRSMHGTVLGSLDGSFSPSLSTRGKTPSTHDLFPSPPIYLWQRCVKLHS